MCRLSYKGIFLIKALSCLQVREEVGTEFLIACGQCVCILGSVECINPLELIDKEGINDVNKCTGHHLLLLLRLFRHHHHPHYYRRAFHCCGWTLQIVLINLIANSRSTT